MISSDLFIPVEGIGLLNDFHDLLELLQLAKRCLLLLQATSFFNGHLPGMAHSIVNFDTKRASWQFFERLHLTLELFLLVTLFRIIEELGVQVVHDEVADLYHVVVELIVIAE